MLHKKKEACRIFETVIHIFDEGYYLNNTYVTSIIIKCKAWNQALNLIYSEDEKRGMFFFYHSIRLNQITNTPIPDHHILALIAKYFDAIFPDPDDQQKSINFSKGLKMV